MPTLWWLRGIPPLFAVVLSGIAAAAAASVQVQATSALLSEFETVFYARADLVTGSNGYKGLLQRGANGVLRLPFADLLGALDSLGKPAVHEIFHDADAVAMGAKGFRAPSALGEVLSQRCYVVVLRSGSGFDLGRVISRSHVVSPAGRSTWKWLSKPTESRPHGETYYATQVAHSYLLISNDASDLRAIATRLPSRDSRAAHDVPEWESSGRRALWGYRRYRQDESEDTDSVGLTDVTPGARALSFYLDSEGVAGVLRLLAADGGTAERMNANGRLPGLKRVSSDAWQTRISLSGAGASPEQMLFVMWLFGFGISL